MKIDFIVHPFFIAVYPLVFLYAGNKWLYPLQDLFLPALIFIAIAALMNVLVWVFIKNAQKSAIIVSMAFFLYAFGWGPGLEALRGLFGEFARLRFILPISGLIFGVGAYAVLRASKIDNITRFLNVIAIVMVLFPIFDIGKYVFQMIKAEEWVSLPAEASSSTEGYLPDIYYVILDAYAHGQTLKEQFGYDNSAFYDYLSQKGFYVAPESRSNYNFTFGSLASSLNMNYLDSLVPKYSIADWKDYAPFILNIENNAVQRFLGEKGYTILHVDSRFYAFWDEDRFADQHLNQNPFIGFPFRNGLLAAYIDFYSPLKVFFPSLPPAYFVGNGEGVLYEFDRIKEIPDSYKDKPVFVFAHIISPHGNNSLDSECNVIEPREAVMRTGGAPYIEKLECTNIKVKEMVDMLLEKSEKPPIIILQSDHGAAGEIIKTDNKNLEKEDFIVENYRGGLRNLIALYLPGGAEEIYPSLTPVNIFRIVFNRYLGADFELLEDKSYFVPDARYPKFIDITEDVKF